MENITSLTEYLRNLPSLINRIAELERWRNKVADPNISRNIQDINTIYNEIKNNLQPAVIDAKDKAEVAASDSATARDEAINAKNITIGLSDKVQRNVDWLWRVQSNIDVQRNEIDRIVADTAVIKNKASTAASQAQDAYNKAAAAASETIRNTDEIRDVLKPSIENARNEALGALSRASTAKTKAEEAAAKAAQNLGEITRIKPQLEEAANKAYEAFDDAKVALSNAKEAYNRLLNASDQLVFDMNGVKSTYNDFQNSLLTGLNNIYASFQSLGNEINSSFGEIKVEAGDIKDEFVLAIDRIGTPASRVKYYVDQIAETDDIIDLAFLGYRVYKAFAHTIFLGYEGRLAIIPEIIRGWTNISARFVDLGNTFGAAGDDIKNEALAIRDTVNVAKADLSDKLDLFFQSIRTLFENLRNNMRYLPEGT